MIHHPEAYALITAETSDYTDPLAPMTPSFRVLAGTPWLHDGGDRPQPESFTLADDDGHVYFHGYLYDPPDDDTADVWEHVFDWGQSYAGTTVLAKGHQATQTELHPVYGPIAVGTTAITDQVIS